MNNLFPTPDLRCSISEQIHGNREVAAAYRIAFSSLYRFFFKKKKGILARYGYSTWSSLSIVVLGCTTHPLELHDAHK